MTCAQCTAPSVGVGLCSDHLIAAYEWMSRETGVTDLLPSPCLACGSRLGVKYPSGWLCAICEWKLGEHPDDFGRPRVDVVYYIRFRDRVKIGTSGNPRQRLGQLRHDELLAFERGNRRVEQARHLQFAQYRFDSTEWFSLTGSLATHISLLHNGGDPWDQHRLWLSAQLAVGHSFTERGA